MTHELEYYQDMDELYQAVNNCIDLLEEAAGTCDGKTLLPLLEESHTALEQLLNELAKYEKE